jgi:hypothetical protein
MSAYSGSKTIGDFNRGANVDTILAARFLQDEHIHTHNPFGTLDERERNYVAAGGVSADRT